MKNPQPKIAQINIDQLDSYNDSVATLLVVRISHNDILKQNLSNTLEKLYVLTDGRENVLKYKESITFSVGGYDFDRRELVEIPEVREFFKKLVQEWPHWTWFLARGLGALPLLFSLLCKVTVLKGENEQYGTRFENENELRDMFLDLTRRNIALYSAFNISEEEQFKSHQSAIMELA